MRIKYAALAVTLASALTLGGVALATAGSNGIDGDATAQAMDSTEPAASDGPDAGITDIAGNFVGLSKADAITRAEAEDRPWRIAIEEGEALTLTSDLNPGRVTFEIENGIVTEATIEAPNTDPSVEGDPVFEDDAQAQLVADAIERLVTIDNSFGGRDVFDEVLIGRFIDNDANRPLQSLDLELVAGAVQEIARVTFVADPQAEIEARFENPPAGMAVVSVTDLQTLDDRAEIGLQLWCGPLCGVFLTYEAEPVANGWSILGPIGPIAIS